MKTSFISYATLITAIILCTSCSSLTKLTTVPVAPTKQTFTYDYKTASVAKPGSANTVIGVIRPHYAMNFMFAGNELFKNYRESIAKDIEELLSDRGYRLKGPYESFDEMVFNDKKDADVAIEIEINPTFSAAEGGWKVRTPFSLSGGSTSVYFFQGSVSLIGKINIVCTEPLSKEKLMVKSVDIPSIQNVSLTTYSTSFARPEFNEAFFNDPNVYNSLGKALQEQYKGILSKIDAHFDPQEFNALKPQIKELKSKKAY